MHGQAAWVVARVGRGAAAASRHLLEVHPDDDPELVEQLREAAAEHLAVGAPDAARRCLERALPEPPLPEIHARVLYELGCATLLTSPVTTIGHLREALHTPGLDAGAAGRRGLPALPGPRPQRPARGGLRVVDAEAARLDAGARPDAAAGRALHVGGHPRARGGRAGTVARGSPRSPGRSGAATTPSAPC